MTVVTGARGGGGGNNAFGDAEDLMKKYGDAAQATGQFIGKQSNKGGRGKRGVGAGRYYNDGGNGVFLLLLVNVALFVADQWRGGGFGFGFGFFFSLSNALRTICTPLTPLAYSSRLVVVLLLLLQLSCFSISIK